MDFYSKEFYDDMVPPESEDCLYLNIWTPASAQPGDKLPVLFWIHGGAFMHGCGTEKEFDGEGMAKKGVILVTINYRVNVFGFFAHPDLEAETEEGVSGNYGILDQLFALKWVRENIAAFGGNPDQITIAGQSAGCMSVQTIISSPSVPGHDEGRHPSERRRHSGHSGHGGKGPAVGDLQKADGAPGRVHHPGAAPDSRPKAA